MPKKTKKLAEIAKTIRSKNAGVDKITFDVIFRDHEGYDLVKRSGVLSRTSIARLFGISGGRISDFVEFDPGLAIKFTIYRTLASGSAAAFPIVDASGRREKEGRVAARLSQ